MLLAEHRLERCLGAADRVVAMDAGRGRLRRRADRVPRMGRARTSRAADARRAADRGRRARAAARRRQAGARDAARCGLLPAPPARRGSAGEPQARALRRRPRRRRRAADGAAARRSSCAASGMSCATARRSCAASSLAARRARRRADGPQRRGQVDAAAPRRRPAGADARQRRARRRVALLLQNPNDYLLHERVADEAPPEALDAVGLARARRAPPARPLRRRAPAARARDRARRRASPRRCSRSTSRRAGWTASAKAELAGWLSARAREGMAVLVATHDAEFAATFARRAVLMADGRVIADGPIEEILAGGWYFATETARILDGAGGALLPSRARRCCARRATRPRSRRGGGRPMSWQLASFGSCWLARRRVLVVRAQPPAGASCRGRRDARRARRARPRRLRRGPGREADHRDSARQRLAFGAGPGLRGRRDPEPSPRTCSSARARGRRGRCSAGVSSGGRGRARRAAGGGAASVEALALRSRARWAPSSSTSSWTLHVDRHRQPHPGAFGVVLGAALAFDLTHVGR